MKKTVFSGPSLVLLTAATLLAASAAVVATVPDPVEAMRQVIRLTARTSILLFLLVYTASALAVLAPSAFTGWQSRNRRWLGLSFAASHAVHGAAIVALATTAPDLFWSLTAPASIVTGGIAYGFIALMALTSWDGAVRALGRRRWGILHTLGLHYLWISFAVAYGKRVMEMPGYSLFLVLLATGLVLRIAAWRRRSGTGSADPRPA